MDKPAGSMYRSARRAGKVSLCASIENILMEEYAIFILQLQNMKVNGLGRDFYRSLIKTKTPSNQESVGIIPCAEGGNRTLIPGGNTILSRARLPIPPLRLVGQVVPKGYLVNNLLYAPQSIPLIRRWSSKADTPRHLRPEHTGLVCLANHTVLAIRPTYKRKT